MRSISGRATWRRGRRDGRDVDCDLSLSAATSHCPISDSQVEPRIFRWLLPRGVHADFTAAHQDPVVDSPGHDKHKLTNSPGASSRLTRLLKVCPLDGTSGATVVTPSNLSTSLLVFFRLQRGEFPTPPSASLSHCVIGTTSHATNIVDQHYGIGTSIFIKSKNVERP